MTFDTCIDQYKYKGSYVRISIEARHGCNDTTMAYCHRPIYSATQNQRKGPKIMLDWLMYHYGKFGVLLFMLLAAYGKELNPGPQTRGKGSNSGNTSEIRTRGPDRVPKTKVSTASTEDYIASYTPVQVVTDQSAQLS